MRLIVAADKNWAIGKENQLLVHLPGDMKYFKEKTLGTVVIMGRSTLESLPGGNPLPERVNIVISRNSAYQKEGCIMASSVEDAVEKAEKAAAEREGEAAEVMVIGGASIYRQMLGHCDICYVTKIDAAFPADAYFPDLDQDPEFEMVWESPVQEEKGFSYRFTEYKRKRQKE